MTKSRTRVLLIDDHDLIRQGLTHAFERADDFEVVGGAGSVAEGLQEFADKGPDVVVTDVRLPDGTGPPALDHEESGQHDDGDRQHEFGEGRA